MITIFTTTHREACLSFASCTDADRQAYDATIDRYYQTLQTQAAKDGYDLEILNGASLYSYYAESHEEHEWYQAQPRFWEWYQETQA